MLQRITGVMIMRYMNLHFTYLLLDEERMRPGHCLGLVLYVPFVALTLLVGRQEEHLACKK